MDDEQLKTFVVQRGKSSPDGTFGNMRDDKGNLLCYTLEPVEPVTPPGVYKCVRHGWGPDTTVSKKQTWEITKVPGHFAVLIHAGNTIKDTQGCILVGQTVIAGGIGNSQIALNQLRQKLPVSFMLEVRGA